jgi:hypothetical protein
MAEFYRYWVSLNPSEPVDMSEFYEVYFKQQTYIQDTYGYY